MKTGILLINLGTPASAAAKDVKKYLAEFLMDPQVVDLPWPFRWFLVNAIILRTRPAASAALYSKIWTERGSPLLFHTQDLVEKYRSLARSGPLAEFAMRYGEPSIPSALRKFKAAGAERIIAVPLYPQFSLAASQSSIDHVRNSLKKMGWNVPVAFLPPFYNRPEFIAAFVESAREVLVQARPDHVVFSFHGLPERQVKRTDPTNSHCAFDEKCCPQFAGRSPDCYRAQCYWTAHAIARELALPAHQYTIGFQSRLGRTPWIKPWSDEIYRELAKKGVKRLAVVSPSFVADCLETLEEIAIRGREDFIKHGGEELVLVPSLNSKDSWARALDAMISGFTSVEYPVSSKTL